MSYSAIESFVEFCDEMFIAEESLKEMNEVFKKEFVAIEKIKNEIYNSKGDYKKQIMLYKKGCNILKSLKSKIRPMDESQFEKNLQSLKPVLEIAKTIAIIWAGKKITGRTFNEYTGAALIGSKLAKDVRGNKNRGKKSKEEILQTIDTTLGQFEDYIKYLSKLK